MGTAAVANNWCALEATETLTWLGCVGMSFALAAYAGCLLMTAGFGRDSEQ